MSRHGWVGDKIAAAYERYPGKGRGLQKDERMIYAREAKDAHPSSTPITHMTRASLVEGRRRLLQEFGE